MTKETSKATVKVYSTKICPWCKKAKEWLANNNVKFTEYDVGSDDKAREEMIQKTGQLGVPVIDINGKFITGYDVDAMKKALGI